MRYSFGAGVVVGRIKTEYMVEVKLGMCVTGVTRDCYGLRFRDTFLLGNKIFVKT